MGKSPQRRAAETSALYAPLRRVLLAVGALACAVCVGIAALSVAQALRPSNASVQRGAGRSPERQEAVAKPLSAADLSRANDWSPRFDGDLSRRFDTLPAWGSYRPGHYVGLRSREGKDSLSFGLMWTTADAEQSVRHACQLNELAALDWLRHDGRSFGVQRLVDSALRLEVNASFIISDEALTMQTDAADVRAEMQEKWVQEIKAASSDAQQVNQFVVYLGADVDGTDVPHFDDVSVVDKWEEEQYVLFEGRRGLRSFQWRIHGTRSSTASYVGLAAVAVDRGAADIISAFDAKRRKRATPVFNEFDELVNQVPATSGFLAVKLSFRAETTLLLAYAEGDVASNDNALMTEEALAESFRRRINEKLEKFDAKFTALAAASASADVHDKIEAAKRGLSALLGGIGYFVGSPQVGDALDVALNGSVAAPPATTESVITLLSATPSRTVFPRGFLWDEGFHQLLILRWDAALAMQIVATWLNAMFFHRRADADLGWIPREMILGDDATRRVPEEFRTQRVNIANPPTLLLVIEQLLLRAESREGDACPAPSLDTCSIFTYREFFAAVYLRLDAWIQWFLATQRSADTGLFRWRGRSLADGKVVPNTLASGLDDYPRGLLPADAEAHLDLHCWLLKAAAVMRQLTAYLLRQPTPGPSADLLERKAAEYQRLEQDLSRRLEVFWSETQRGFFDVGMNNESAVSTTEVLFRCYHPEKRTAIEGFVPVQLLRSEVPFCPPAFPVPLSPVTDGAGAYRVRERLVADDYRLEHVPRVGYVSLFPLLLQLLPPSAPRLGALLDAMANASLLWTDFGLRSLAATDRFYRVQNAGGDAPYWRGPIWMNINYLALSALKHYAVETGPHQASAAALHVRLRAALVRNVFDVFQRTGFFWEQYDDVTGQGLRGRPFTGWTALIVNILLELY